VHLYFLTHHKRSAIMYYRSELPQRIINRIGLARADTVTWQDLGLTPNERIKNMMNSSALLFYTAGGKHLIEFIKQLRKHPIEDLGAGRFAFPPAILEDCDDNTHYVNPLNPAFGWLGTRNYDGTVLKPGETLWIVKEDGEKFPIWEDGKAGFNVRENVKKIRSLDTSYRNAQGVSFATARLKDYYTRALGLKNTYHFPNSVLFEDYPDIRTLKTRGQVRVLWQGGDSHYGDWYSLRPVLKPLTKRFPEVRWLIWGAVFPFVHKEIPEGQLVIEDWLPYDAYKIRLATLDFDFAVAPLVPNIFNEAKSAIKFYEAAALPRPRCVLAARTPPYSDEIVDGETGMLYGDLAEFESKFEALVRDRALRERLAANAKDWLAENRLASKTVPKYFEWISETIAAWQKLKRKLHVN